MAKAETLTIEVDTSEAMRKLDALADQIRSLPAIPAPPKLEAVVTLPIGAQLWVRFDADGTPLADMRAGTESTWRPISFWGGTVVVAP